MKLSELVALRNGLKSRPVSELEFDATHAIHKITTVIPGDTIVSEQFSPALSESIDNINKSIAEFGQTIEQISNFVDQQITEQERKWFQESYKLFEVTMALETNKEILNRRLSITGENTKHASFKSEEILRGKLSSYADWRFPAIIIRPGLENFINEMVGYDPLYIVDQNYDLLKPCMGTFPKQYQNRLRPYTLNDRSGEPILEKIPNNQFGMCLVYNFLNYRPLEVIRKYLSEIFIKLRPGGICLMTINDCDFPEAVRLVENNFACYTPGYLVRELIKTLGFNITGTWGDGGPSVWLEIRKPGTLDSLRGSQVVTSIKNIAEIENDIDFLEHKPYTKEELDFLYQRLRDFGVDENEFKDLKPNELTKLIDQANEKYLLQQELRKQEEIRLAAEAEKKRIEQLHEEARSYGVDPTGLNELDVNAQIHEKINAIKKQELVLLRQRAMELRAGDPNLIRYGYSAEKLKQLIKAKEEENK